jgi:hypothetical protein
MGSDDLQRPKRKATPAQAAYLRCQRRLTKKWRHLWKTKPNVMERAREKATLAAALKKQDINLMVSDVVREWPSTFTAQELRRLALALPYIRLGRKRRMPHASLVRRLRSMTLISYDPSRAVWVNLLT